MKRLFKVHVEAILYAIADDEGEAEKIVQRELDMGNASDDISSDAWVSAMCVTSEKDLIKGWATALPYGDDDSLTCREVLDAWLEWERTRPRTAAELEAAGQLRLIAAPAT